MAAARGAFDASLERARAEANPGWGERLQAGRDALGAYESWRRGDTPGAFQTLAVAQRSPGVLGDMGAVMRLWMGRIAAELWSDAPADHPFVREAREAVGA